MAREFRWLAALHPVFPLAPQPYLLCEDATVVGSIFYIMERRRGIVVRHDEPLGLANQPARRRRVSEALVDTLAALHAIDVTEPLARGAGQAGGLRRASGAWLDRTLARDRRSQRCPRWSRSRTGSSRTCRPIPSGPRSCTATSSWTTCCSIPLDIARIVAVFDWEMSALGDPLVDLGILLAYWAPTAPPSQRDALTTVTHRPGWLDARRDHRPLRGAVRPRCLDHLVLRNLCAVQDRRRHPADLLPLSRGQTDDARFATFGDRVLYLARQAQGLATNAMKLRIRN